MFTSKHTRALDNQFMCCLKLSDCLKLPHADWISLSPYVFGRYNISQTERKNSIQSRENETQVLMK